MRRSLQGANFYKRKNNLKDPPKAPKTSSTSISSLTQNHGNATKSLEDAQVPFTHARFYGWGQTYKYPHHLEQQNFEKAKIQMSEQIYY